jgi:hypothetical protein
MKTYEKLRSVEKVAEYLKIGEELVMKFIMSGIVKAVAERSHPKLFNIILGDYACITK